MPYPAQATQLPASGGANPLQNAALFQQLLQQMGYGQTNLAASGMSQTPPGTLGAPNMPAGPLQAGAAPGQAQPGMTRPQGNGRFTPQEMAALGRMGDSAVAHLSQGEITVPPQLQSPKVLATLNKEYAKKGVSPAQFTVGSPASSRNPATGAQELSFWSNFLPVALGIGGSLVAPGLGTALGSTMSSAALAGLGSGAGTAVGGLASGQSPMQAIGTGALSGLGSYYGGQLLGPSTSDVTAKAAQNAGSEGAGLFGMGGQNNLSGTAMVGLSPAQEQLKQQYLMQAADQLSSQSTLSNLWGAMPAGTNLGSTAGSLAGSQLGSMLFSPSASSSSLPSSFTDKYKTASELPSAAELLGSAGKTSAANFTGYNPYVSNPMAYRFFA